MQTETLTSLEQRHADLIALASNTQPLAELELSRDMLHAFVDHCEKMAKAARTLLPAVRS